MRIAHWMMSTLAAAVMVVAVTGCGSSSDEPAGTGTTQAKQRQVGLFLPQGNPMGAAMIDAAKKWAASHDATVKVFDVGVDPQKQYAQMQDAIAGQSLDGIAFVPLNGPALAPVVKQAEKAGVPSVAANIPMTADLSGDAPVPAGLAGQVWEPPARVGKRLAEQVTLACEGVEGRCQSAYLSPGPQFPSEAASSSALKDGLKQDPNMDFVGTLNAGLTRSSAVGTAQDLLQAHPDINVIAGSDQLLLGAEVALKKAGRSFGTGPGDVRLVGSTGTTEGIKQVTAGHWSSTQPSLPKTEMTAALDILDKAMRGTLAEPQDVDVTEEGDLPPIMTKEAIEKSGFTGEFSS